jgi:hypothetical protein
MRVEWAKAHTRANRWKEEVLLLTEETRHVVAYLDWKASWWRAQGSHRDDVRPDITDGLTAYAHWQADLMQKLVESFAALWYPMLIAEGISIEWPEHYITYVQTHPPKVCTSRRKATAVPEREDSGSDRSDSEEDKDEGDDADVSPYR